jgi:capsular polysaccharide biosynthesis protein
VSAVTDAGAEREIDLGRWKQAALQRWWVVAAGLVIGAVIGGLYSLSGGSVWQASVLIAPGQAFSPNGAPILNYLSSPLGINDLVTGEATIKEAARKAGVPVSNLRGHVSTQSVLTGAGSAASRGTVLVKITVQLHQGARTEAAANALGAIVKRQTTSSYVQKSVGVVQSSITSYESQLKALAVRIDELNKAIPNEHDPLTKIVLVSQLDNAAQRQATMSNNLAIARQQLALAQNVEYAQIIQQASAVKTTARSRRNSTLVGALIGLVVGLIVAIALDLRARRAESA